MKPSRLLSLCLLLSGVCFCFPGLTSCRQEPLTREEINFNSAWKFHKGDTTGAQDPSFNDTDWREVDLPHDWSIEGPFSKEYASGTGYLPGGVGWYRKSFKVASSESKRKVFVSFGGIYNNSEVWINGNLLGKRPNGYVSFQYELTPFIRYGERNTIAVRVDHSKFADSRWYTGSGIYRNVRLLFTPAVHVMNRGVYASTEEVTSEHAILSIKTAVKNDSEHAGEVIISNYLLSGADTVNRLTEKLWISPATEYSYSGKMRIEKPLLWFVENPYMYSLVTIVKNQDSEDKVETGVGFRDLRFDPDKGFFLNGISLKLKGICMHHDAGCLGSAVPSKVIGYRLDLLKELGCNAIRTSHNPFSEEFLDLCDQKGFLVIDEAFDEWEISKKKWVEGWNTGTPSRDGYADDFEEWHEQDLKDMILRDRNHPSIIMWSIGNEVDYPNDPYTHPVLDTEANPQTFARYREDLPNADRQGEVARELVAIIRDLDTTRPVTAGLASAVMSNETGYADALDVAGYNYQEFRYQLDHYKYPARVLYGSENGQSLEAWNAVVQNDFIMGQFLWTGIEYLGEAGRFPSRHSTSGIIDLAGNKKPEYYFRQSLWSSKPMIFIGTTDRSDDSHPANLWAHKRVEPVWKWVAGKEITVSVFTNCDEAELFLNDRSLGRKKMSDFRNNTISWLVAFEEGTLKAVGYPRSDDPVECILNTFGDPVKLTAEADVTGLIADRQDVAMIFVNICDKNDNLVYSAENEIICEVAGPVRIIGMEDSNPVNTENYKDNRQHSYHGRLLIYVQSLDKEGKAVLKLSSGELESATVTLDIKPAGTDKDR